jgi:hemerythrin superfamily protein
MANTNDLIAKLLADHQEAKQMFSKIENAPRDQVGELFWELTHALVRHEVAEEEIVYPQVRKHLPQGEQLADLRIEEQSEAEELLAKMEKAGTDDPTFSTHLLSLRNAVLAHAEAEESSVFMPLSTVLEEKELVRLGGLYDKAKKMAPTHPHPNAPDTPPGNVALGPVAALIDRTRDAIHKVAG